jgi:hypothetical protein
MDDWRLQGQERFLKGACLIRKQYVKYRPGWDHDHCEFCWRKLSENPEDLNSGYATPDDYHWICEDCFRDFREKFEWKVIDPPTAGASSAR